MKSSESGAFSGGLFSVDAKQVQGSCVAEGLWQQLLKNSNVFLHKLSLSLVPWAKTRSSFSLPCTNYGKKENQSPLVVARGVNGDIFTIWSPKKKESFTIFRALSFLNNKKV